MIIKLRPVRMGGHIHVTVFTADAPNQTFANSGELVFREKEYGPFEETMLYGGNSPTGVTVVADPIKDYDTTS